MKTRQSKKSDDALLRVAVGLFFLALITLLAYEGTVLKLIEEWFIGIFTKKLQ